jgi:hypothetical protein
MFESLQEGIVVIQNEAITFSNTIFAQLFQDGSDNKLDQKIYKVYRTNDEDIEASDKGSNSRSHPKSSGSGNKSIIDVGKIFSLRQLIRMDASHLEDKIFEIDNGKSDQEAY